MSLIFNNSDLLDREDLYDEDDTEFEDISIESFHFSESSDDMFYDEGDDEEDDEDDELSSSEGLIHTSNTLEDLCEYTNQRYHYSSSVLDDEEDEEDDEDDEPSSPGGLIHTYNTLEDLYNHEEYAYHSCNLNSEKDEDEYAREGEISTQFINVNNTPSAKRAQPKKKNYLSYTLAQKLIERTSFVNVGGVLYAFNGEYYVKVDRDDVIVLLKEALTPNILGKIRLSELKDAAEQLLSEGNIRLKKLEPERSLVLFNNGMFDLRTGQMVEGPPRRFCIHKVDANYGHDEDTPYFDHFLEVTSGGNPQIKNLIVAFLGYCLIPDLDAKRFFILGTAKDSGKSMLARLLQALVGEDVVSNISLHEFHESFGLAPIVGKILNISMDICGGKLNSKDVSYLKMLTGQDTVMINDKHTKRVSYKNISKLVFGTNIPISLHKDDDAFWERLIIIPFRYSIPKEEQDKDLFDKLWRERNGIVYKAMREAAKLINNRYEFPECIASERMKHAWRNMDYRDIIYFVEDCCDFSDENARTRTVDLYSAYLKYCEENFEEPRKRNSFAIAMKEKYDLEPIRKVGSDGQFRGLKGIRLKPQGGDTP